MATFHREGDMVRVFVKGAPDVLAGLAQLDAPTRAALSADVERLAARRCGPWLRPASIAAADYDSNDPYEHLGALRYAGLVGIMDPPRA